MVMGYYTWSSQMREATGIVVHDNDVCTERNNIEWRYLKTGRAASGGARLCGHCRELNEQGR